MKLSRALHAFVPALAALALLAPAARSAGGPGPLLEADTTTIAASDEFQWSVGLVIRNTLPIGLYLDSLRCDIEELNPASGPPRRGTVDLDALVGANGTISSGDVGGFTFNSPAIAEHAKLSFRMRTHGADGTVYTLVTVVTAGPNAYALEHPSQSVAARGKKVEIVPLPAEGASGPVPGVLLVHAEGANARELLRPGQLLARAGYHVMLVSLPGSGHSEGPADLGGPATIAALEAALERLKATPGVDPAKLAAWGVSRGASAVASLAAKRADLSIAVLQSGLYDLWACWRAAEAPGARNDIVAQAGRDSAAWRERSPIYRAAAIKGTVFVLHGERDADAPAAQARSFLAALQGAGVNSEAKFFPQSAHTLPRGDVQRAVLAFLRQHFGG